MSFNHLPVLTEKTTEPRDTKFFAQSEWVKVRKYDFIIQTFHVKARSSEWKKGKCPFGSQPEIWKY